MEPRTKTCGRLVVQFLSLFHVLFYHQAYVPNGCMAQVTCLSAECSRDRVRHSTAETFIIAVKGRGAAGVRRWAEFRLKVLDLGSIFRQYFLFSF